MVVFRTIVAVAGVVTVISTAPSAAAAPECVNTGPTTTLCQTAGHSQIITSPSVTSNPYGGYPYGGFGYGGFGIGFSW